MQSPRDAWRVQRKAFKRYERACKLVGTDEYEPYARLALPLYEKYRRAHARWWVMRISAPD